MEENKNLSRERAHLSELMRNLQTIQHEHERSGASEKRRLETDIKRLETDLYVFKSWLEPICNGRLTGGWQGERPRETRQGR